MKFNSFFVIGLFSEHMDIDPEDTAPESVTEPAEDRQFQTQHLDQLQSWKLSK